MIFSILLKGGDFSEHSGRGGESIYGGFFEDENFDRKHDRPYLLSMANRGKNTNGRGICGLMPILIKLSKVLRMIFVEYVVP